MAVGAAPALLASTLAAAGTGAWMLAHGDDMWWWILPLCLAAVPGGLLAVHLCGLFGYGGAKSDDGMHITESHQCYLDVWVDDNNNECAGAVFTAYDRGTGWLAYYREWRNDGGLEETACRPSPAAEAYGGRDVPAPRAHACGRGGCGRHIPGDAR